MLQSAGTSTLDTRLQISPWRSKCFLH